MSRSKKITYTPPNWKSIKQDKKFVMMFHSMLNHVAYTTLTDKAKLIYVYMCDYSNGMKEFTYPHRIYKNICSNETFLKAVNQLEEHGLIEVVFCGKHTKTENIYAFSTKWKDYKE